MRLLAFTIATGDRNDLIVMLRDGNPSAFIIGLPFPDLATLGTLSHPFHPFGCGPGFKCSQTTVGRFTALGFVIFLCSIAHFG
ncbi:MAG: hypothetical protein ACK58Z_06745, partial [Pseudanabaena sp.]